MGKDTVRVAYAAYAKNDNLRMTSSSGAVFSLIAEHILCNQGVVYGVALTSDCRTAEFCRVEDSVALAKIRGSKYLQAHIGDTLRLVKDDLCCGKKVLFSGTGCQINGLKAFLGKEYDNLICVDLICHGVPSPALWRKYIVHKEVEFGSRVMNVNFRSKKQNWEDFGTEFNNEKIKEVYISKDKDAYMQMFLRDYCLRPSCYACKARNLRFADITLADFWRIDSIVPEMNDGKGSSLVLVRTPKGQSIFEQIKEEMVIKEVTYEDGVKGNSAEYQSPLRPTERETFYVDMKMLGFDALERKYAAQQPVPIRRRLKKIIKKIGTLILPQRHGSVKKVMKTTS